MSRHLKLGHARKLQCPPVHDRATTYQALILMSRGDLNAAREALNAAEPIAKPFLRNRIWVRWLRGMEARLSGRLAESDGHLTEAIAECRRARLVELEPDILTEMALLHLVRAREGVSGRALLDEASRHAREALEIAERCEYVPKQAAAHNVLAWIAIENRHLHTHTRAFALARKDLDEAFSIATRCGLRLHEADAHLGHARLSLAEGAPAAARPHVLAARQIIEATGYHRRDGEVAELDRRLSEAGVVGAG
jgi:tetratricopeptide (TPR) repeat protein